jgi:hypothetical protein
MNITTGPVILLLYLEPRAGLVAVASGAAIIPGQKRLFTFCKRFIVFFSEAFFFFMSKYTFPSLEGRG